MRDFSFDVQQIRDSNNYMSLTNSH